MARHRNIRSMNYSDEYDYDDVYGHSVEDDYCVSPSEAAFMYNRESSRNQQIGAFIKDIAEEDESDTKESAEMEACIAKLKSLLGPSATKQEMTKALLDNQLDIARAADVLLDASSSQLRHEKKDKDDKLLSKPTKKFNVPKLNSFTVKSNPSGDIKQILSPFKLSTQVNPPKTFASLSDLSSNHLKNLKGSGSIPSFKINKVPSETQLQSTNKHNTDHNTVGSIDLTKALIKDVMQKSITNLSRKFDYLDVNCKKESEIRDDYSCTMDISFILKQKSVISKRVSPFGHILCRRYKKFVPVIKNDKQSCKFLFDVLSPDDLVMSYLKT